MDTPPLSELIDLETAAAQSGVSRSTLYRWTASGQLPAWKLGGRLRIRPADLQALLVPVARERPREEGPTRGQDAAETRRVLRKIWPNRER